MTISLKRNFPLNLDLAKKYANGIPKSAKRRVEIVAVIKLSTKLFTNSGLVIDSRNVSGLSKVKMLAIGYAMYAIVAPANDKSIMSNQLRFVMPEILFLRFLLFNSYLQQNRLITEGIFSKSPSILALIGFNPSFLKSCCPFSDRRYLTKAMDRSMFMLVSNIV
jgi:hypothetical protein